MKIKKAFLITLALIGLLSIQTASNFFPRDHLLPPIDSNLITFDMLGEKEVILNGPYASYYLRFYTPINWKIKGSGQILLSIEANYMVNGRVIGAGEYGSGAKLDIYYNGNYLKTIGINWAGAKTISIPIPVEMLQNLREDGSSTLYIFLNAAVDCDLLDHKTTIVFKDNSGFVIPHDLKAPDPDLTKLPRPIYDQSPLQASSAILVVPDNAQPEELRAAMIAQAGFSRMTGGNMPLPIYTVTELTEAVREKNHIIFVGLGASFPYLYGLEFPAVMDSTGINWPGSQMDDGIIQMILSPRNNENFLLYIGGNSILGVQKAAQAFSTGKLQIGPKPNLMIISQVSEADIQPPLAEIQTFKELGYPTQTLKNLGANISDFQFYVPPGMVPGSNPSVSIIYTHSALLDFTRSGLFVRLNNQSIGSAVFTPETAKETNTLTVALPPSLIRAGYNRLTIEADLLPYDNCSLFQTNNLWVTLSDESSLHLPLVKAQAGTIKATLDLKNYPHPFSVEPNLSSLAFIIPMGDAVSLKIANQLAANLGKTATGAVFSMNLAFSDQITEEVKKNNHLIIIGRASQQPIIFELAKQLPAPFEAGSDLAAEKGLQVTYRLPEGSSLGYLQLLPSPWNDQRAILAVLGTTPEGVQWAGDVLTKPDLTSQMAGNYDVIRGTQVLTTDTRLSGGSSSLSATALPGSVPVISTSPQKPAAKYPGYNRSWLVMGMVVLSLAILGIIISVIAARLKNRVRSVAKPKSKAEQRTKSK